MTAELLTSVSVSIVMPAHNAAHTIAASIDSVVHQISPYWELIVVDDGSVDETAAIVDARIAQDARIRRISQPNGGVSSARNLGTASARYDWLMYLDADDLLEDTYLERMTAVLVADPHLDAVHCGWVRIASDGTRVVEQCCTASGDMFEYFTRFCAFPVHACVFRRSLADAVGGWDTTLCTCEDWDFWQRISRTRARFGVVPEHLSFYSMRPGSASLDARRFLADGLRVVHRLHNRDPRVSDPNPAHAEGAPKSLLSNAVFSFLCWPAGLMLGAGGDARELLDAIDVDCDGTLDYRHVAGCLLTAALLPGAHQPEDWPEFWPTIEGGIEAFLTELERRSGVPGLARRSRTLMERKIVERTTRRSSLRIGRLQFMEIEITEPLKDIAFPPGVERFTCVVKIEGERLSAIHLPVVDGTISRALLADAIASEHAWIILGKFFSRTVYRELRLAWNDGHRTVERGDVCLIDQLHEGDILDQVHSKAGWHVFLQELWGKSGWPLSFFYDDKATGGWHVLLQKFWGRLGRPLSFFYDEKAPDPYAFMRPVATNRMAIEISDELPDITSDTELDVKMGGIWLGWMTVPASDRQQLRIRITRAVGRELCRVAVRETLVGWSWGEGGTLRARLATVANARRQASSLQAELKNSTPACDAPNHAFGPTDGIVMARRWLGVTGSSASRRAEFPSAVAQDLIATAEVRGDSVFRIQVNDSSPRVVYAPQLIGNRSVPLTPPPRLKYIGRGKESSQTLPILLYHRIAEARVCGTASSCISPSAFEAQLRFLRDSGACSVTLKDWQVSWEHRHPLKNRSILITFDDGYRDFMETAWPLLKFYGFSALLFVVTGEVGRWNRWDVPQHGDESVPLLDWNDLRCLRDDGVEFGSHTMTHPYLTGCSQVEIIREATQSQMILERELGRPTVSFSYPYGESDEFVQHWIGACGYLFGFTCRPGLATYQDRMLSLPRIEITSEDTTESFAKKIGF